MISKTFKPLTDEKLTIDTPKQELIYWVNTQRLKPWINVEWWAWVKTLFFTRDASVWTWLQTFSWFWFTPKSSQIKAFNTELADSITRSLWWYDWTTQYYFQLADWWSVVYTWKVLRVFYTNQWWWKTSARHSWFTWDWIILNFDFSQENIRLEITAYA